MANIKGGIMKVVKVLKKHVFTILLVIGLLFIQAMCDLALPDYTSKIVNIGIQQNGIEDDTVKIMSEQTYMEVLSPTDNKELIENSYELATLENTKDISKYIDIKDKKLYVLINDSKEVKKALQEPFLIVSMLHSKEKLNISTGNEGNIDSFKNGFHKQIISLDDSFVSQMTISAIKGEYDKIGFDTEKLQMDYLIITGLKMLLLALLAMSIAIIVTYLAALIAATFSRDLRSQVVSKVMELSHHEVKQLGTASLITRSTNDIQQVQMLLVMFLRVVIYAPILGLGALSKISGNSMSWIIGIALLVILSLVVVLFTIALPKFKIVQKLIDRLNLVSREVLTGLPVIRAFSNEKHEEKRFDKANKDLVKVNLFVSRLMSVMMPTMMFIMNGVSVLIIWVGASKVDAGNIQVGTLIAFITYTMQIIISFLMISLMSIMIPRALVSLRRISEVLNKNVSIKDSDKTVRFKEKGSIEFNNVSFRYPDASKDILTNISFKIKPNTTTAFIGSTGSGKSTLISLVPRFYDVTGGKITIDGIDIKDIPLKTLRSKIGYVPQTGVLFNGSVKSNIAFGNDKISDDELLKVAKISQSLEFIDELDDKFDSFISQGGTNISGGQKQRLSIARALAINPEFYIFDDSFSALDYKTDSKLRKALKDDIKATVLIVAQRISTVMQADQIVVLNEGQVVGIGKHKDLLKSCDVYREIALSQLGKEELSYE